MFKNNFAKALTATTILAGVVGTAKADPTITMSGSVEPVYGFVKQDKEFRVPSGDTDNLRTKNKMGTDMSFQVKAENTSDTGVNYGTVMYFENYTDDSSSTQRSYLNLKKGYAFAKNQMGHVQVGNGYSASRLMKLDAYTFARADRGFEGKFGDFVTTTLDSSYSSSYDGTQFIDSPHLTTDREFSERRANKFTYFSPKMNGFQLGASYTPDLESRGEPSINNFGHKYNVTGKVGSRDILNLGATYETNMKDVGLKVSTTGEFGKAKKDNSTTRTYRDVESYHIGAAATYRQFTLAGSYADQGSSLEKIQSNKKKPKGKFYTAGLSYVDGPWGASVSYIDTKKKVYQTDNSHGDYRTRVTSVGADYKLWKGVNLYASGSFFKYEAPKFVKFSSGARNGKRVSNDGNLLLVGVKSEF